MMRVAVLALVLSMSAPAFAASTAMPACSAGDTVVWVNTHSHAYHRPGDPYFGKTKAGMYQCESAARAAGAHLAGSKTSSAAAMDTATPLPSGKHHKHHAAPVPTQTP